MARGVVVGFDKRRLAVVKTFEENMIIACLKNGNMRTNGVVRATRSCKCRYV